MSKLYFKYGTMDASKSADLLMTVHKYEQQGKNIICMRSNLDTRTTENFIESRALTYRHSCYCFDIKTCLYEFIEKKLKEEQKIDCILIDEAQFLTKEQVIELTKVVDFLDIPVICYGLKNSYIKGELFEGSKALLYFSDSIQEIKSVCHFCNKKATMNLRVKNGSPIRSSDTGNTVVIGDTTEGEDYFISTCRRHYFNPPIQN